MNTSNIEIKHGKRWATVATHENYADALQQLSLIAAQNTYTARLTDSRAGTIVITPK